MQTQVHSGADRQTVKRLFGQAAAIASVAALVACSGSPSQGATATSAASSAATPGSANSTSAVALPAVGVELPPSQIPWNQVGQGWMLSTWSAAPGLRPGEDPPAGQPRVAPSTLYLLDPAGGRYPLSTFPVTGANAATGDPGETLHLADWSGDGKHALFSDGGTKVDGKFQTTVTDLDLTTGAKQTFTVPGARYVNPWVSVSYTRPAGKAVLVSTTEQGNSGPSSTTVKRVDLSGAEQLTFPTELGAAGQSSGGYLESPDGSQLVFGATNGMVIVGNDGVVGRQLPAMPADVHGCSPVRWWTPTEVLARCDIGEFPNAASQLWLVPVDSGAPTGSPHPIRASRIRGSGTISATGLPGNSRAAYSCSPRKRAAPSFCRG